MGKLFLSTLSVDRFGVLDGLGLTATGQVVTAFHGLIGCRVLHLDNFCHDCGVEDVSRGTGVCQLTHLPIAWRLAIPLVRVRGYRCTHSRCVWREYVTHSAAPRAKLSRLPILWALKAVVIDRSSMFWRLEVDTVRRRTASLAAE